MNRIIDISVLNLAGIILRLPGWFDVQYVIPLAGMMTDVILAGSDPFTAIKYQIAIMFAKELHKLGSYGSQCFLYDFMQKTEGKVHCFCKFFKGMDFNYCVVIGKTFFTKAGPPREIADGKPAEIVLTLVKNQNRWTGLPGHFDLHPVQCMNHVVKSTTFINGAHCQFIQAARCH